MEEMERNLTRDITDDERLEEMMDLWYATIGKVRPGDEEDGDSFVVTGLVGGGVIGGYTGYDNEDEEWKQ